MQPRPIAHHFAARRLSIPTTILCLLPLAEDERSLVTNITQVVLLETYSLFISDRELYQISLGGYPAVPLLVQSYVLNACCIAISDDNVGVTFRDKAFILTAEYSLLLCELCEGADAAEGSMQFTEVCESILSESEVEHLPPNAPTSMCADLDRGMVVVVTQLRILIMSMKRRDGASDAVQVIHMLGSCLIDVVLQAAPVKLTEEGKENIEFALEFAANSYLPAIEQSAVWGGAGVATAIACSGNGRWMQLYLIEKSDESGIWGPPSSQDSSDETKGENTAALLGDFFPIEVKQHTSWITALSSGSCTTLCASGDASGGLLIWMPNAMGKKLDKDVYIGDFSQSKSITSIMIDSCNRALWVADSSGLLSCALYNEATKVLERIRTIKLFCNGCGITYIQWIDNALSDNSRCRLRAMSGITRTAVECLFHDSASVIVSTPAEPTYEKGHSSAVEVCAVFPALDLVITAGCGDKAWVWDIQSCQLLTTITSKDRFFTSICTYDSGFVPGGTARILTGHGNGHTHEYVLIYEKNEVTALKDVDGQVTLERSFSLSVPSLQKSISKRGLSIKSDSLDLIDAISDHKPDEEDVLIQNAASLRPHDQDAAESEADRLPGIGALFTCKADFHSSSEYLPFPVTQILTSALGFYHVFCYAQSCIVIHSWEDQRALAQIQFDETLVEISCLSTTEDEDLDEDSFTVVLQGRHNVKLLDAIRGKMLTSFDVGTPDTNIVTSALWDLPVSADAKGNRDRRIIGFAATSGPSAFVFGDMTGCRPVPLQDAAAAPALTQLGISSVTSVDRLVLGCQSFGMACSPYASIWTMRSVFWLRFNLQNALPEVLRVQEYLVPDDKVRVILAQAMKLKLLANRVLVVLSDGTMAVYTL